MTSRKFIFKKIIEIAIIFFIILTLLFFLFRLSPGSPISKMVDPTLTLEDQARLIEQLGLDKPAVEQYIIYLKNFFTGNFGSSFHYGEPVSSIIMDKLPWTILLFSLSTVLAAWAGVILGKISAWNKGSAFDNFLSISALICHTLFIPWFALLLLWQTSLSRKPPMNHLWDLVWKGFPHRSYPPQSLLKDVSYFWLPEPAL